MEEIRALGRQSLSIPAQLQDVKRHSSRDSNITRDHASVRLRHVLRRSTWPNLNVAVS